ncbi:hypothetical protein ACWEOW_24235 [Monashia sp. NPDC004114]
MNAPGQEHDRVVVRRGAVVDRLDTADGTVVLVDNGFVHRVLVLSPVGSTLLDVLDEAGGAVGLPELTEILVERLGEPDGVDPEDVVWQAVDALTAEHVVVSES